MREANSADAKSCAGICAVSSPFGFRLQLESELVETAACLESLESCVVSIFGWDSRGDSGVPVNRYVEAIPACAAD